MKAPNDTFAFHPPRLLTIPLCLALSLPLALSLFAYLSRYLSHLQAHTLPHSHAPRQLVYDLRNPNDAVAFHSLITSDDFANVANVLCDVSHTKPFANICFL